MPCCAGGLAGGERAVCGQPLQPAPAWGPGRSRPAAAREQLAAYLGCGPLDIVWTSGATESNNLVMHHYEQALEPSEEVWLSAIEHPCVIESAQRHFGDRVRTLL